MENGPIVVLISSKASALSLTIVNIRYYHHNPNSEAYLSHSNVVYTLFSGDGWQEEKPGPQINSCNIGKIS